MILTVTLNAAVDSTWVIENFTVGSVLRVNKGVPLRVSGGKGINVARVISILGEDVLAIGFVGGCLGNIIEKELTRERINHEFIRVQGESREDLIVVDTVQKTETIINGSGPDISLSQVEMFNNLYSKKISKCNLVCLCGSLPPGVPKDIYANLIKKAYEKKVPVILDTSSEALNRGIIANPFMIKLNIEEVKEILPDYDITSEDGIIKAAKNLIENAESVVITRGKDGSIVCTKKDVFKIKPIEINAAKSVGSGDAFVGGCAVAISRGKSILDAVKLGTAAGTANAEKLILNNSSRFRIDSLMNKVEWSHL